MGDDPSSLRIEELSDALRSIAREAAAARSALCENELVIRLDNILSLARTALARAAPEDGVPDAR